MDEHKLHITAVYTGLVWTTCMLWKNSLRPTYMCLAHSQLLCGENTSNQLSAPFRNTLPIINHSRYLSYLFPLTENLYPQIKVSDSQLPAPASSQPQSPPCRLNFWDKFLRFNLWMRSCSIYWYLLISLTIISCRFIHVAIFS